MYLLLFFRMPCRISQGTDIEVDEAILKNNRALLEVEIESQYPIFPSKAQLDTVKAEERRDGYMELKCVEGIYQNVSATS